MRSKLNGPRIKTIRWSLKQAAEEFDRDIMHVTRKLKAAGIQPGEDNMFSTQDIVKALFEGDRARLVAAQVVDTQKSAALKDAKTAILNKKWCDLELVEKVWSNYIVDLRQKIQNLDIPLRARSDILSDLQTIPVENYFTDSIESEQTEEDES